MFPELGFYGLAGHAADPRALVEEVREAEQLGLGAVFLSERFNYKDAAVLSGAAAASTDRIGIATAATNHNTRHPLVTATMATTAHRMSGGRFALGLGRGFDMLFDLMGVPRITNAQLRDAVAVQRRLWRGERFDHDGPSGRYPFLFLMDEEIAEDIPVLMVALGPKALALAGEIADAVVLHTFMSDEAVARSVATARAGAEQAGRDPDALRIWACTAVVEDSLPREVVLKKTVGRLATYLQGYGDLLVRINGWDPAALQRFREDELVAGFSGAFDAAATVDQLDYLAEKVIPQEWLDCAITGSAASCAQQVADSFSATGVDSVILHGSTPAQLAPVVDAYAAVRRPAQPELPANPGRMA
ncbi:TIGR03857 family LLM class F420-dependent oxidoreductase [Nocardioides humilatus]|uniref:TIGR03857 family LLM class F420-dependent oxidoreductase n=1 Tax=Nocardioides humilatus TaxID=2607660 RepID=A0A5B1L6S9_9ACTN|nr:TIGR03857 family LLM class F420-dependent oxidoreductase [Nocardioides humilatus]KAA1416411.1 TIGR03857 family LLM class F420-dependent oxidoreductase [Nocardioides humilatus]